MDAGESLFSRTVSADVATLPVLRNDLRRWFEQAGIGQDTIDDLLVAFGEALTNAIEHGHVYDRGPIDLRCSLTSSRCEMVVSDRGAWRPPPPVNHHRGQGVRLMQVLMDEVRIEPSAQGTEVTLTRRLP